MVVVDDDDDDDDDDDEDGASARMASVRSHVDSIMWGRGGRSFHAEILGLALS